MRGLEMFLQSMDRLGIARSVALEVYLVQPGRQRAPLLLAGAHRRARLQVLSSLMYKMTMSDSAHCHQSLQGIQSDDTSEMFYLLMLSIISTSELSESSE